MRIDASKARALPGVLAVVTHEDVPDVLYGGMVKDRRLFARDTVRFEGDIVAGVAATTAEIAEQAAALIEVDYEPLPVVTDFEAALARRRPARPRRLGALRGRRGARPRPQHARLLDDREGRRRRGARRAPTSSSRAATSTDSVQGVPIEPRAIIAQWQGDRVTVWTSTQVPYVARGGVAHALRIPESHVRVIVPLLGGGFGAKCDFHFEGHVAALARAARRPVKLVFSRREEFVAVGHRREGMVIELETGARSRRHARRPQGAARARQGRVLRRGRLLRADGRDARLRPVRARERARRVVPRLHEQPAVVARSAPRRRRRCAGRSSSTWTSSPPRSGSTPSSCAAAR